MLIALALTPLAHAQPLALQIEQAEFSVDETGLPVVDIMLTEDSGKLLRKFTAENVGRQLAMSVNDKVIVSATIMAEIGRELRISGDVAGMTAQQVREMAQAMSKQGVPLEVDLVKAQP
jgi:preprotein translocase subunit SecD